MGSRIAEGKVPPEKPALCVEGPVERFYHPLSSPTPTHSGWECLGGGGAPLEGKESAGLE